MKCSPVLAILMLTFFLAVVPLGGCSSTPRQEYRVAALTYDATAIGLAVAKPKINAVTWQHIQEDESVARQRLAAANQWLQANPTLADVPGANFPPLDPLNITLDVMAGYLDGVELVNPDVPTHPTIPPTATGILPTAPAETPRPPRAPQTLPGGGP